MRMLQRALRTQEQPPSHQHDSDEDVSSADEALAPVANSFDLLGTPDEPEDVEEEGNTVDHIESENPIGLPQGSLKKVKKKKKKKGKRVVVSETPAEDDVDLLLERFSLSQEENTSSTNAPTSSGIKLAEILTVDTKQLRAEDELKRIFGSKVINAVERGSSSNSFGGLRRRQGMRQKAGRGNFLKRTILVTPKEVWPFWDGSISMELTLVKDGLQYFQYTYSNSYMETQKKYQMSAASYDPDIIARLLVLHPYHLESLLSLADLYKHVGEYQQSVECLERCIFALECAWHPSFNPFNGSCRLPFDHEMNKPFFLALSKHMLHLGRRGCHRSALEVCKLLLSLDADDPLGALFSIDYFALRAEQFEWLERFADCYSTDTSLRLLPNYSFSLAVARFYRESQQRRQGDMDSSMKKDVASSHDLFKQALLLHPATLRKLVDKAPIKEDSEWGRILRHPHFKKATPGGPSLEHLITLYVERNHLIWRVPDLQAQLKSAASAVIAAADQDSGEVANWACVRQEAFSSEHNEYKHLHFSDFSDTAPPMPPEELQNMMFRDDGGENNRQNAIEELEGRNVLQVFLQTLLPWNDYGADLHGQDVQGLVREAGGGESDAEEEL